MQLTCDGIVLRTPQPDDTAAVAEAVRSSLPELGRYLAWATDSYHEGSAEVWRQQVEAGHERTFLIVDSDGTVAGSTGLNQLDPGGHQANLGYWLRTDRAGRGLATRAAHRVARWGFDDLGLHRIEISMVVGNEPSRKVAERIGARFEGRLRERVPHRGRVEDLWVYGLLADDLTEPHHIPAPSVEGV